MRRTRFGAILNSMTTDANPFQKLLTRERVSIVEAATSRLLHNPPKGYDLLGPDETRRRVDSLYGAVLAAVTESNTTAVVEHAREVATERYWSGFPLSSIFSVFNALEETLWLTVVCELDVESHALALAQLSTMFGVGKDVLACAYAEHACAQHTPPLDLAELAKGTALGYIGG
jgi:hypothetical protein